MRNVFKCILTESSCGYSSFFAGKWHFPEWHWQHSSPFSIFAHIKSRNLGMTNRRSTTKSFGFCARALCEEIEMVAISYALWLLVQFCKCWKVQGLWERGGEKGEEVGLIYSWCSSGSFYEAFQSSSFREDWKWPTNRRTRIWSTCKFSFQFAFTRHWRQQSYNWICNMHF